MKKKVKNTEKKTASSNRDITSYVTKMMLLGNISTMGIPRAEIEKALERYCDENPRIDATSLPIVGASDKKGKDPVSKAIISLAKKHCGTNGSKSAVFSKDGKAVLIFGKPAKEIVSKMKISKNAAVERLKTKIKVSGDLPLDKKLNCFGGEKISDKIK